MRTVEGERLSLREAVRRWCASDLVRLVQEREAEFPAKALETHSRWHLGGGSPSPVLDFAQTHTLIQHMQARLNPAVQALRADFCQRVSIGRILLDGLADQFNGNPQPAPIPLLAARHSFMDLAANIVERQDGLAWREVTARLNTGAVDVAAAAGTSLSLEKALLTWCDDELVDRFETARIASQLWHEVSRRDRSTDNFERYRGYSHFDVEQLQADWRRSLAPAEQVLHADFRTRIADGRIQLSGLQIAPDLASDRSPLPPVWASRMQFDWRTQRVRVEGVVFADVEGSKRSEPRPRPKPAAPKQGRGRPAFPMDEMIAIARSGVGTRAEGTKAAAEALLTEFKRLHPLIPPPSFTMIRRHATSIYASAATDAADLKS